MESERSGPRRQPFDGGGAAQSGHPPGAARCDDPACWCALATPVEDSATPREDSGPPAAARFPGYEALDVLGQGGNGVVYRAFSPRLQRTVALKVLAAGRWATAVQRARFRREVDVQRELADPGVVPILDDGVAPDGTPWIAMELVEGPSLARALAERGPFAAGDGARIVEALARTVARLHARGVFHRDIKPSNVLLRAADEPLLSDFGLVLESGETDRLTRTAQVVGTPRYMAPEQVLSAVEDWAAVDIFGLGRVLQDTLGGDVRPPGSPAVPDDLLWIARRAAHSEPGARYRDAAAMAADLAAWRAGGRVRWSPAAVRWRARRAVDRHRGLLIGVGSAALAAGAFLAAARWRTDSAEARAADAWDAARPEVERHWAAGNVDAARRAVEEFAGRPAVVSSRAAGGAWMDYADLASGAGRSAEAIRACGQAIAATDDQGVLARAAAELVGAWRRTGQFGPLSTFLDQHSFALRLADLDAIRGEAALAFADVETAASLLPPGRAAVLRLLRGVSPVAGTVIGAVGGELVTQATGVAEPAHSATGWSVPPGCIAPGWGVLDGLVTCSSGDRNEIFRLDTGGATRLAAWSGTGLWDAEVVAGRLFVATGGDDRGLREVVNGVPVSADPATDALGSYVVSLDGADLDGDGRRELIASIGPPMGFAVRVWDVPDDGPIRMRAQARLGYVWKVVTLDTVAGPRVLATTTRFHPSKELFGEDDPYGGPCRLAVLRLDGAALVETQRVQLAEDDQPCRLENTPSILDLDGDGLRDVALAFAPDEASQPPETWLMRQGSDGLLEAPLRLGGYGAASPVELAGATGPALLLDASVSMGTATTLIAGAGSSRIPPLPRPAPVTESGKAALLEATGLYADAARVWESRGGRREAEQTEALRRAAQLWGRAGELERGEEVAERAARLSDPPDRDALALAAELAISARDWDRALVSMEMLDDAGASAGRLRWLRDMRTTSYAADFAHPLIPAFQVLDPHAVRQDMVDEALTLDVPNGAGPVLRVPLRATGAAPWMRLEGDWKRSEWASELAIYLGPVGDAPQGAFRARIRSVGGGGFLFRQVEGPCSERWSIDDPAATDALALRISGGGGAVRCTFRRGEASSRGQTSDAVAPAAGDAWELILAGDGRTPGTAGALTSLRLRRLEFGGLEPVVAAEPAADAWVRWSTHGGAAPPPDPARLAALLREEPAIFGRLEAALGSVEAGAAFADAWGAAAESHPGEPVVGAALLRMPDLRGVPADIRAELEAARGEAQWRAGDVDAAGATLTGALRDADAAGAWRVGFGAAALLSELHLALGDTAAARQWADTAIARAPDADLARTLLAHRPRLTTLHPPAAAALTDADADHGGPAHR